MNKQFVLAKRPQGPVTPDCFRLEERAIPTPAEGQVLVKHHYMSLDPYMRGRMDDSKSYAASQVLDAVMGAGTVGEVVESRLDGFKPGDHVVGMGGWQQYSLAKGGEMRKIDTRQVPISAYLGTVGMPGVTAWVGTNTICQPKAGETLVVTAASGAVGSVVGQLAKAQGVRAVGIAGGAAKCAYVKNDLGFDDCIDYKAAGWQDALKAAAPNGIDCVFENVGGEIFDFLLSRMNAFGRIAVCGLISGYNGEPYGMKNIRSLLVNRLTVQGFIVSERMELWPKALSELGMGVATGKIKYRETVAQGLEAAPQAFIGLLKGENFGKQVVKLI